MKNFAASYLVLINGMYVSHPIIDRKRGEVDFKSINGMGFNIKPTPDCIVIITAQPKKLINQYVKKGFDRKQVTLQVLHSTTTPINTEENLRVQFGEITNYPV